MALSISDVALVAPLSLSILAAVPAAASSGSQDASLMTLPVYGMVIGTLIIAAYWALDYDINRAAYKRLPGEVLHP